MMKALLSLCTTRVACYHITDSERTEINEQMEETVESVDLAINGRLFGLYHWNQYIETAENEYNLLVQLVDKILQRRENENDFHKLASKSVFLKLFSSATH